MPTADLLALSGFDQVLERLLPHPTFHKRAVQLLESYRYALDQAAIVAMTDASGHITYANDAFCRISQYSQEELLGQDHRLLNSGVHDKEFFRQLWLCIGSGKVWRGEICNRRKDGQLYWVQTTIVPFTEEGESRPSRYMAVRFEITQDKQLEEQVRWHNQHLERIVEERTQTLRMRVEEHQQLNAQLKEVNEEVNQILQQLDHRNQQIHRSLGSAQRIQQAILPSAAQRLEISPEQLFIFRPKAVVSGDLYWMQRQQGRTYFALADCTGHGISGAFMTMIGKNILDGVAYQKRPDRASEFLSMAHFSIRKLLRQWNRENQDGMDIALCILEEDKRLLHFAGAGMMLFLLRDGQLRVYKGDKRGIGGHRLFDADRAVFEDQLIELQPGDKIYLFTDGFYEQPGGPEHRRFGRHHLQDTLCTMGELPMEQQQKLLLSMLDSWQGKHPQNDDISAWGFSF